MAMAERAGFPITFAHGTVLGDYDFGDITSKVFSMEGTLTDWAYGAGWDKGDAYARERCEPSTDPELASDFFKRSTD